jgi:hypothetical protein
MAELENNQFRKNATAKAVTREDNLLGRGRDRQLIRRTRPGWYLFLNIELTNVRWSLN